MRRLEEVLSGNVIVRDRWEKHYGHIYQVGKARVVFLSGSPTANIVGATASTLLSVDEAQDIRIDKYDKEIAPMAASTNATKVFWGTAWTSRTLLARELRAAKVAQEADGIRRVFHLNADMVIKEVPAYGQHLAEQIARLGRSHPMIRTQYYCEEIDAEGGLFTPERQMLMRGAHPPLFEPSAGATYAMLVDVAGADEGAGGAGMEGSRSPKGCSSSKSGLRPRVLCMGNPGRDATALTIVSVEGEDATGGGGPTYRVVHRRLWVGEAHTRLYAQIRALAESWQARRLVVDATGIGAGLAAFLDQALPGKVRPFVFSAKTKSKLGWGFLALVDSGRFKDYAVPDGDEGRQAELSRAFFREAAFCQYQVGAGPDKAIQWGVPDGTRDPASGELVHDDLLISASLCAVLDEETWAPHLPGVIIPGADPMKEIDHG
jgi:hypothetical protein